jgi:hypothetical protein
MGYDKKLLEHVIGLEEYSKWRANRQISVIGRSDAMYQTTPPPDLLQLANQFGGDFATLTNKQVCARQKPALHSDLQPDRQPFPKPIRLDWLVVSCHRAAMPAGCAGCGPFVQVCFQEDGMAPTIPTSFARLAVAMMLLGVMLVFSPGSVPAVAAQQSERCFPETGFCIGGRFAQYWQQNGGLPVFGYPLSDELTEQGRTVQYFERQRFELHTENAAPYDVLLGLLGSEVLAARYGGQLPPGAA